MTWPKAAASRTAASTRARPSVVMSFHRTNTTSPSVKMVSDIPTRLRLVKATVQLSVGASRAQLLSRKTICPTPTRLLQLLDRRFAQRPEILREVTSKSRCHGASSSTSIRWQSCAVGMVKVGWKVRLHQHMRRRRASARGRIDFGLVQGAPSPSVPSVRQPSKALPSSRKAASSRQRQSGSVNPAASTRQRQSGSVNSAASIRQRQPGRREAGGHRQAAPPSPETHDGAGAVGLERRHGGIH